MNTVIYLDRYRLLFAHRAQLSTWVNRYRVKKEKNYNICCVKWSGEFASAHYMKFPIIVYAHWPALFTSRWICFSFCKMLFAQCLIDANDVKSNSSTISCPRLSPFTSATMSATACLAFSTFRHAIMTLAPAIKFKFLYSMIIIPRLKISVLSDTNAYK